MTVRLSTFYYEFRRLKTTIRSANRGTFRGTYSLSASFPVEVFDFSNYTLCFQKNTPYVFTFLL